MPDMKMPSPSLYRSRPLRAAQPVTNSHVAAGGTLIVLLGRGRSGKSFLGACIIDWLRARGTDVVVADGDRTNRSLTARYTDASSPADVSDAAARRWLEGRIAEVVDGRKVVALDMGGGDTLLLDLAREVGLVPLLEGAGVTVLVLHMLGNAPDDTSVLEAAEEGELFAPRHTALVLNRGATGEGPSSTFSRTIASSAYQGALARGAVSLQLPELKCAATIQARQISLEQAERAEVVEGLAPLSFIDRQRVRGFRRELENMLTQVADWLPS